MTVASSGSGLSSTGRPGIRFNSSGGAAAGATHSRLARIARALRTSAIRSLFVLSGRVALRYSGARIPANPGAARVVGGGRYKLRGRVAARGGGGGHGAVGSLRGWMEETLTRSVAPGSPPAHQTGRP